MRRLLAAALACAVFAAHAVPVSYTTKGSIVLSCDGAEVSRHSVETEMSERALRYAIDHGGKASCTAKYPDKTIVFDVPLTASTPPTCPAKPADESRTAQCPAGSTGNFAQTLTYTSAPAPTCWIAGAWLPISPPAGACNRPPTITGTPTAAVVAGQPYSFVPVAADPDADSLALTIVNRPTWATFNAATGALTGTPTATNVGITSSIVITVSDGKASASTTAFSITVTAPPPPSLTAPTLSQPTISPNVANSANSDVRLTWTAVTGATSYEVERCSGLATCTNFTPLATATALTYPNTNLPAGLTFRYRVRGVDASRQGPYSGVQTIVTPTAPPPTGAAFIRINAGGPAVDGYLADQHFVGGSVSANCRRTMTGVFATRRFHSTGFEYRIPVTNGTYAVRLLWRECWSTAAGQRVLSANVEGQAIPAFDTWRTDDAEIMHERAATVADGTLNIALTAVTGDAMLNAIEVTKTGADPDPPPPPATGSATLSWTPPTENTDGSVITNLAGFRIQYGTSTQSLTRSIDIPSAGINRYVVEQLSAGTWFFTVTARASNGFESARSNTASRVVQ